MKIGVAQIKNFRNISKNIRKITDNIIKGSKQNIELLCFPECCTYGYAHILKEGFTKNNDVQQIISNIDLIHEFAIKEDINVIIGTPYFYNNKLFNTALVLLTNGKRKMYHKNNLIGEEKKYFKRGVKRLSFKLNNKKFGILICRDQNYPLLVNKYKKAGAKIIFILASHYYPPVEAKLKRDKNKALPIARAVENGVYIFKANSVGRQATMLNLGGSIIVDPSGYIISEADSKNETILSCYVDKYI